MPSIKTILTTAVIAVLAVYVAKMVLPAEWKANL